VPVGEPGSVSFLRGRGFGVHLGTPLRTHLVIVDGESDTETQDGRTHDRNGCATTSQNVSVHPPGPAQRGGHTDGEVDSLILSCLQLCGGSTCLDHVTRPSQTDIVHTCGFIKALTQLDLFSPATHLKLDAINSPGHSGCQCESTSASFPKAILPLTPQPEEQDEGYSCCRHGDEEGYDDCVGLGNETTKHQGFINVPCAFGPRAVLSRICLLCSQRSGMASGMTQSSA
jgi:hypothetical protein